ncbi:MAG: MBL fold metallo-hydrolase [Elusimicrobiota bacterium]
MSRLTWAALLVAAGCASGPLAAPPSPDDRRIEKSLPAPKDIRAVDRFFRQQLVTHRKVDGLKIQIFDGGSVTVPGAAVSSLKSWLSRVKLDVPVFLIRHPKRGLVLFDTGMHPDMETMPARKMGRLNYFLVPFQIKPGQNIVSQLKALGVEAEEIKWVVVSHMHMDHAGMIDAFPKATVLVDRREWEAQKAKALAKPNAPDIIDTGALEPKLRLRLVDLSSAPAYGAFDHGEDLFGDGTVFLIDLAGHTAGNMGAWVNLDDAPVLLAGDASWILDNHQDLALPLKGHIYDVNQYWRRLFMMREAQKAVPSLIIFPGHDLGPLKLQPNKDVELVAFPR